MKNIYLKAEEYTDNIIGNRLSKLPDSSFTRHTASREAYLGYIAGLQEALKTLSITKSKGELEGAIAVFKDVIMNLENNQAARAWEFVTDFKKMQKETEDLRALLGDD